MSLCEVQFFISRMHNPCKVSERDWYITIFNCDGTLLEYADRDYIVIHAPMGHAHVHLPPGKYYAIGVWGYWIGPDGTYHGNHFTHKAIFQVDCGNHYCVWIYNPSIHECGIIYDYALKETRNNIEQTRQDLVDAGVDPADPRFGAIDELGNVLDNQMPAVNQVRMEVDNFAQAFGFAIPDGIDINRMELLDATNTADMDALVEQSSAAMLQTVKMTAQIVADVVK